MVSSTEIGKEREEAERQQRLRDLRNHQALNERVKADRLRRILGQDSASVPVPQVQAPPPSVGQAGPGSQAGKPTPSAQAPISTQGSAGISGTPEGNGVSMPTATSQMTCPHHPQERLAQVHNRMTGKDVFRCPQVLCGYEWKPDEVCYNTVEPDDAQRDPTAGIAKCLCGYTAKYWKVRAE